MSGESKRSEFQRSSHDRLDDGIAFQHLLEHMLNGVAYCNMLYDNGQPSDFIYLYTNPAFEKLTGLNNVTGKLVSEVIPGIRQSDPELFNIYGSVAAGGAPIKFETYIEALGMWFSLSVYSPKQAHFVAMFDIISERKLTEKQLKQSEETYRNLFETIAYGVIYQNTKGQIISANSAAERILGLSLDQMQGRTSIDPRWGAIHEDSSAFPGETHPVMLAIKTGKPVNDVVMGINNPIFEHPVWIKINAIPVFKKGTEEIDYAYSIFEDITEQKKAEAELEKSRQQLLQNEEQLRCVLQGSELGFWDWNIVTNQVQRNARWAEMLGYTFDELINTTSQWTDFIHPDDREKAWQSINDVLEGKSPAHKAEYRMLHKDGSIRWILDQANVIECSTDGKPTRMSGTHTDITDRKQSENALEHARNQLIEAQKIAHLGSFEYDAFTQTTLWSEEEYRIYGLNPTGPSPEYAEILAKHIHPDDAALFNDTFMKAMESNSIYELEHRIVRPDGSVRWVYDRAHPYFDMGENSLVRYVGATLDITDRKRLEEELERHAHVDFLTGLSNRRHFMELAELEFSRAARYNSPLSFLMMDIDFFKQINDKHGHKAGDLVLQKLASICNDVLREVDIIGRIGGEEFAILLPETDKVEAFDVAERLRSELASAAVSLSSAGLSLHFTVSIGLASLTSKEANINVLLSLADKALYLAKNSGRNKVSVLTQ
jgi:diguanylate cyclase (GGDEF)-like protein/PAS domain S-box-containing protein